MHCGLSRRLRPLGARWMQVHQYLIPNLVHVHSDTNCFRDAGSPDGIARWRGTKQHCYSFEVDSDVAFVEPVGTGILGHNSLSLLAIIEVSMCQSPRLIKPNCRQNAGGLRTGLRRLSGAMHSLFWLRASVLER